MNVRLIYAVAAAASMLTLTTLQSKAQEMTAHGGGSDNSQLYEKYFDSGRLRMDLTLYGNASESGAALNGLYRECGWSGSHASLIDTTGFGNYSLEVFSEDRLIYSRGFCSLFEEWLSTPEAERVTKSGGQSVWMPFPKNPVTVVIKQREKSGTYKELMKVVIDPADRHIVTGRQNEFRIKKTIDNGEPAHKVDIVFVSEGYTVDEMEKFEADASRMAEYILSMEPYCSRRKDFNIWTVECPSADSSVSIPQDNIWKVTALGSMFDTFYTDRYLTIMDQTRIASAASGVPFDAIIVVANSAKYGGGGFYNSYAMGTSDNKYSLEVIAHEFGHSFAALGDEYYDSEVAYEDYYPAGTEPWEPNITTQVAFDSKWKDMVESGQAGLYEGAGYQAKGCWRGWPDCRMLKNDAPGFCPVCQRAINRMIDFYVK